jgi:hypothetical protein
MLKILFTLIATLGVLQASGADPTELADMVEQPIQLPRMWIRDKPIDGKLDQMEQEVLKRIRAIPESEIEAVREPYRSILCTRIDFFEEKAGLPVVDAILEENFPGYSTAIIKETLNDLEYGRKTSSTPQEIETLERINEFLSKLYDERFAKQLTREGEDIIKLLYCDREHPLLDRSTPEARDMNNVYWAREATTGAFCRATIYSENCLAYARGVNE